MTVTLQPGKLQGKVAAMPSKYDLHRLMIAAYLAGIDISGLPLISNDIATTSACLLRLNESNTVLNCRDSGSTLRFLLPIAAALDKACTFTGEGRLPERPMGPLVALLREHGCNVDSTSIPLTISGQLRPGVFMLPGNISSQYVTGLLFALPLLPGDSEIVLTSPLESSGYVKMTLKTLKKFNIFVQEDEHGYKIPGNQDYLPPASSVLQSDADWSNAAFWLAANALGSEINIAGLDAASIQPDRAIAELLARVGAPRKGIVMDASQCPDLVPIMAVVMALSAGESRIIKASRLRLKESDRLHAMAVNLQNLGANVKELPDGLAIQGVPLLRGGEAGSFDDHRIAMAMAIAALKCEAPLILHGAEAVSKSYPRFWEDYRRLKEGI